MKKYSWIAPLVVFNIVLIIARVVYTGSLMYSFLIWNIFLAILPLYFSLQALRTDKRVKLWLYSSIWLLFFPNSMYIITDLFHLGKRLHVPLWYDLLLLFSSAMNGIIFGFLSLSNMEKTLVKRDRGKYRQPMIFVIMLMCRYGIYLGRFDRWNSWDIIAQPYLLVYNIAHDIIHPLRNMDVWALSILFGTWLYLLYRYTQKIKLSAVDNAV